MRNRWAASVGVLCLAWTGCESASSLSAVTSLLRVEGAQRIEGPPPSAREQLVGPSVSSVTLLGARIWPGQIGKPLAGSLAEGATAVSLFLDGDSAHYVLPAGPADVTAKSIPTFSAALSFSPQLPLGLAQLWVQSVDEKQNYGIASVQSLWSEETALPQGALVIALRWERAADLDLHVEQPDGQELWSRRKSGLMQPGPRPSGSGASGYLDQDGNALCMIDGQQRERVVYPQRPAPGRYRIRVDTFSLCEQVTAYWQVAALIDGVVVAAASGQSVPSDTRGSHGQGAGTLALELVLP